MNDKLRNSPEAKGQLTKVNGAHQSTRKTNDLTKDRKRKCN